MKRAVERWKLSVIESPTATQFEKEIIAVSKEVE